MSPATSAVVQPGRTRVIVGMSGGVDSSVAAMLLVEQGFEVHGLFMKNWEEDDTETYCAAAQDLEDAKLVCQELGIPLHQVNFAPHYRERVFQHFLHEYQSGRTPNPDILCNQEIKFGAFLDYARRLGADLIATGHYARVARNKHEPIKLLQSADAEKDQTYFLHRLDQKQLAPAVFPLGELHKREVRALAEQNGLHNFERKDSTGICFIGERHFADFLARYLLKQPGPICTPEGRRVGTHSGLQFYTIGQRQGLGIGGLAGADEQPWYVAEKIVADNTLIVVQGGQNPLLLKDLLEADELHWVADSAPPLRTRLWARIRHRQPLQPCCIPELDDLRCVVRFDRPQRAVTPGQSVVLYHDQACLGGGVIHRAWSETADSSLPRQAGATG